MNDRNWKLSKRRTGIPGLDAITRGGLPSRQATLIVGFSGTGKSVLALQILANSVAAGDGGVFVSFEESPDQIRRNVDSFEWGPTLLDSDGWRQVDARPHADVDMAGEFDLEGLLAAISAAARPFTNPWIVIDGIDQLLQRHTRPHVAVDQMRFLNERCEQEGWSLIVTGKGGDGDATATPKHLEGVEFMLPTAIVLTASIQDERLIRKLRIAKYRGSEHGAEQTPLVIDSGGISLPYQHPVGDPPEAGNERISTGIPRLDRLLGGGPFRGSSMLISGRPGTAKSTLAASCSLASAKRGEKVLYISFDELQSAYVRNLVSVGIDLQPLIDDGLIEFHGLSARAGLVADHILKITRLVESFEPDLLIIDPLSAMLKSAGSEGSRATAERVIDITRSRGITSVVTSLTEDEDSAETTQAHASTIADTWIVLDYNVRAGERNRSLSIVKSRGSAHSNQQRELHLSDEGVDLYDVFEYGTDVLMGTARLQRKLERAIEAEQKKVERKKHLNELEKRLEEARSEAERLDAELEMERRRQQEIEAVEADFEQEIRNARRADRASPTDGGES